MKCTIEVGEAMGWRWRIFTANGCTIVGNKKNYASKKGAERAARRAAAAFSRSGLQVTDVAEFG